MGDKSPNSKYRNQKQKNSAKAEGETKARSKQDSYSQAPLGAKGKK